MSKTRTLASAALASVTAMALVTTPSPAVALSPQTDNRASSAVKYARSHGVRASVAVIDTVTGRTMTGGSTTRLYSSASVSKVFVAAELLATGQMKGWKASTAYTMITRSDNGARDRLLPYVGYAKVYDRMVKRYHVKIGQRSTVMHWTGDTQLTSIGMAKFYQAVKKDKRVWPWLYRTMSKANRYAAGGVPQFFGIPASKPKGGFAIKQGWFKDRYHGRTYASSNTTGYIDHGRYVVVILSDAPAGYYGSNPTTSRIGKVTNYMAKKVIYKGRV